MLISSADKLFDLLDGGEGRELSAHLAGVERLLSVEEARRAIVLCVCGLPLAPVEIFGGQLPACVLVEAFDLRGFALRRMAAWAN
jgi:hypothetical protein